MKGMNRTLNTAKCFPEFINKLRFWILSPSGEQKMAGQIK